MRGFSPIFLCAQESAPRAAAEDHLIFRKLPRVSETWVM